MTVLWAGVTVLWAGVTVLWAGVTVLWAGGDGGKLDPLNHHCDTLSYADTHCAQSIASM